MTDHLSHDTLNDLADDRLSAIDRALANAHLRDCEACAAGYAELRAVISAAAELPRDVSPPPELWRDVQATLSSRDGAPSSPRRTPGPRVRTRHWIPAFSVAKPGRLAAAAVALVALSSAATVAIMRSSTADPHVAAVPAGLTPLAPASWESTARGYEVSVTELRRQLDSQRQHLAPATIAAVERSLAAIDVAIAEAREALQRDPANAALNELMASNYRQKVELLRRATQLTAAT